MMSGFYFAGSKKLISDFPPRILLLIVVFFTLAGTVKDIKDTEGDRAEGISTIPVLFGEKRGKEITGALVVIALLSVPVILGIKILFWPSLAAAVLGYIFVNTKPYREWPLFVAYFVYVAAVLLLIN